MIRTMMIILILISLAETEGNIEAVLLWNASIKLFHSRHAPEHHIHTHHQDYQNDYDDDENQNYEDERN